MRFVGRLLNIGLYVGIIYGIYKKYVPLIKVGGIYGTTGKEGKNSMDSSAAKLFDKACKGLEKGQMWTDKSFPATIDSIRGNAKDQSSM